MPLIQRSAILRARESKEERIMNNELRIMNKEGEKKSRGFGIIHNSRFLIHPMRVSGGFTLVEMLVSVGLFSLVMLMATGSVLTIVNANKKSHSLNSVMTNLNFALESMSREIRVGIDFACLNASGSAVAGDGDIVGVNDCTNGNVGFRFTSNKDYDEDGLSDVVEYSYNSGDGRIYQEHFCINNNPGCNSSPVAITAEEINIEHMRFYVIGTGAGDGLQPRVLITIKGKVGEGDTASVFNIQTTASQRLLDL